MVCIYFRMVFGKRLLPSQGFAEKMHLVSMHLAIGSKWIGRKGSVVYASALLKFLCFSTWIFPRSKTSYQDTDKYQDRLLILLFKDVNLSACHLYFGNISQMMFISDSQKIKVQSQHALSMEIKTCEDLVMVQKNLHLTQRCSSKIAMLVGGLPARSGLLVKVYLKRPWTWKGIFNIYERG